MPGLEAVKFALQFLERSFGQLPVKYFKKCTLPRIVSESHKALNNLYRKVTVVTRENTS